MIPSKFISQIFQIKNQNITGTAFYIYHNNLEFIVSAKHLLIEGRNNLTINCMGKEISLPDKILYPKQDEIDIFTIDVTNLNIFINLKVSVPKYKSDPLYVRIEVA
ncbi:MAG TPA: hypothetical protein VJ438_04615 [Candidatus Nanoarchaeia archaeon]|nr:hypothetical protein [Candidatus Nanoarchaeia archaeon]